MPMNYITSIIFIINLSYSSYLNGFTQFEDSIKYAIKENQPGETRIGRISEDVSNPIRIILRNISQQIQFKLQKSLSLFTIDPLSSVLRTKMLIDLEELCPLHCPTGEMGLLNLVVNVWENMILKGIIKIEINIQDVNDNAPMFLTSSILKNVKEVIYGIGKSIELQKAIDRDISKEHNRVSYILETGEHSDTFRLKVTNDSFPLLILKKALDYEHRKIYQLVIWAWNPNSDRTKTKLSITIHVLNINDMEPKFRQQKYEVSVHEDLPINSMIVQVEAVDEDDDTEITYRATDSSSNLFIVSKKGQIFLKSPLDFEITSEHIIEVQATDNEFIANTKVIIKVLDVNDHGPHFSLNPSICRIEEGQQKNIIVGQIEIKDRDSTEINGKLECSEPRKLKNKQAVIFKPSLDDTIFHGKYDLYTRTEFDREDKEGGIREILIICNDSADKNPLTSTMTISLTIVDVNDNAPTFSKSIYVVYVEENNSINLKIIQVKATDKDVEINGIIHYAIDDVRSLNANKNLFVVDPNTGWITVSSMLDREKENFYQLIVVAKDNGSIPKQQSSSCTINITVLDVNDHSPKFSGPTKLTILENQPLGTLIDNLRAVDQDAEENGRLIFSLLPNHNTHLFFLNPNGSLYSANKFDREISNQYCLQIEISDQGKRPLSVTHTVCIEILDINDNPPRLFFPDHISKYIKSNTSDVQTETIHIEISVHELPGFEVLKAESSDPDEGVNSQFQFRFKASKDQDLFSIDPFNGNLKLNRKMNRDSIGEFNIQIIVEDNGTPSQISSCNVVLKIKDMPRLEERLRSPLSEDSSSSRKFQIAIIFSAASAILAFIFICTVLCIVKPCAKNSNTRGDYSSVGRQFLCDTKTSNLEMQNDHYLFQTGFDPNNQSFMPNIYNQTLSGPLQGINTTDVSVMGATYPGTYYNQFSLPRSSALSTNSNEIKSTFSPIYENSKFQSRDNIMNPI